MYFSKTTIISFSLLATTKLVAGHAAITGATGDQGGTGSAIGVDPATPRDGTRRNPFQQDATRFRNENADQCGETLGGGANDVETGTQQVMAISGDVLPQVSAGGEISMTVHQVNGDGAGPYTCMIDSTGTGTQWEPIQVTQNIDGNRRGRNNDQQMQDLPLTASIPANQECTGTVAGQTNVCMVRCENPARAGPFGGCVPVQMAGAANAAAPGGVADANNTQVADPNAAAGNANLAPAANANANTGNANVGNANAANGNVANTGNVQDPAAGNLQQAPAANANGNANLANGNANLANGNANLANGNANTAPAANNNANANANNANLNANANANANTAAGLNTNTAAAPQTGANTNVNAGTPALTNDDQEEEVALTDDDQEEEVALTQRSAKQLTTGGPILTDDDQEEEVELLEGEFARRWVIHRK